jgi:hypothetical protein
MNLIISKKLKGFDRRAGFFIKLFKVTPDKVLQKDCESANEELSGLGGNGTIA